ncbi:hypothetical protein EJB05_32649, partial [Eragrostis curvula]
MEAAAGRRQAGGRDWEPAAWRRRPGGGGREGADREVCPVLEAPEKSPRRRMFQPWPIWILACIKKNYQTGCHSFMKAGFMLCFVVFTVLAYFKNHFVIPTRVAATMLFLRPSRVNTKANNTEPLVASCDGKSTTTSNKDFLKSLDALFLAL